MAGMHFSLWPSVKVVMALNLSLLSAGGLSLVVRGLVAVAAGLLALGWVNGFEVNLATPKWATAASVAGIVLTTSVLGYLSHIVGRRALQNRRMLIE